MKKVLLLSLSLVLGFSAFAQQRVAKADLRQAQAKAQKELAGKEVSNTAAQFAPQSQQSVVVNRYDGLESSYSMWTFYDLQSNQYVANRMYQLPNGSVATTATMSHENNQTASDRGTGYNFFNAETEEWLDQPEERVEPFKTGWPSIAQWKENGEILLAHGNGHMQCFTREKAGEGEWQYMGALPDYPEGYPYAEYGTWPRVVTCGDNHDVIVAVAALQHSISSDETDIRTVMYRSTDAQNWTISYGPLEQYDYHIGSFSADDYALAANGHNVALLYSGCLTNSTWMFKSTDDGLTWETYKIWENPYEGRSFEFEDGQPWGMEDTLFFPMNGAVVIDNKGVTHVALNTFEMIHTLDNESGYYSYWSGRAVDDILYWNDTQEAPMQDTYHPEYAGIPHLYEPNPHHVARLWWPIPEEPGYVHMVPDSTKWIGYVPMYEGVEWSNDMYYMSGTEYVSKFYGASGHPALSCDPMGNLACAFSAPNCSRPSEAQTAYYRSIYVSYRNVDEGYWHQIEDDITDDFLFSQSENCFTFSVLNTVNPGEFWFGYQSDDKIGFYWGSNATQSEGSQNDIIAAKLIPAPEMVSVPENHDAINPMTAVRVYPNPATDVLNIEVNASQSSAMSINVFNIMGQKVMESNVNINTGMNTPSISTADFASGIYFVTVKANGFENTMKFIVK